MNGLNPTITYKGEEYKVLGHGTGPWDRNESTHMIMAIGGAIREIASDRSNDAAECCMYLRKIRPRHNFGRLILEETGEVRKAIFGDAFLTDEEIVTFWSVLGSSTGGKYRILEVVEITKFSTDK